jgi:hypothetical protein
MGTDMKVHMEGERRAQKALPQNCLPFSRKAVNNYE